MPRETLVDILLENREELEKYFKEPLKYVGKIKEIVRKHDPKSKVLLFGSLVKERLRPNSDIDVLVITNLALNTDERIKLRVEIASEIGDLTPFEIHIITPEEYEKWYRKFIDKYIEV